MNFNKLILPLLVVFATNAFGFDFGVDDQPKGTYYRQPSIFVNEETAPVGSGVLLTGDASEFPLDYGNLFPTSRSRRASGSWDPYTFGAQRQLILETQCKKDDGLVKLLQDVNIGSCWENRNLTGSNDILLIETDRAACKCVSERTNSEPLLGLKKSDAASSLTSSGPRTPAQIKMDIFDKKVTDIRSRMDHNSWGMTFQASVISNARPDFTSQFTINTGDRAPASEEIPVTKSTSSAPAGQQKLPAEAVPRAAGFSIGESLIGRLMGRNGGGFVPKDLTGHGANIFRGQAAKDENIAADLKISDSMARMATATKPSDTLLAGEEKFKEGQCIGAREFFAYKQVPDGEVIQKEFMDRNKLTPDNWNYRTLRKRYDELIGASYDLKKNNREEIILLKEKLKFLERNPLMKNFLQAETEDLTGYLDIQKIPKDRRDKINSAYYGQPLLSERKKALMEIVKKAVPPADCKTQACMIEYVKNNSAEKIKTELSEFFGNPMNAEVTAVENDKANIRLAQNFLKDKANLYSTKPSDFTYPNIVKNFSSQYGVGSPSECVASNLDYQNIGIERCAKIFISYCRDLEKNKKDIDTFTSNDRALMDDLDSDVANFFETDMDKNPEFKKFNDEVCNTKRRENSGKQDPTKFMSFWDYKKQACRSSSGCNSPKEIEDLRIEYLKKYPVAYNQNEAQAGKVIAFNRFIEADRIKNVPKDKIEAVVAGRSVSSDVNLDNFNKDSGFTDNVFDNGPSNSDNSKTLADAAVSNSTKETAKVDNKFFDSTPQTEEVPSFGQGYSYVPGANAASNTVANNDQAQKVENMTDPQRQELMDDWQKEYDAWKKNKNANDGSPAANANETAMQARIQALEQLLAQQKKLTEDQYKLLNDAIANQNKPQANTVAANDGNSSSSSSSNGRNRSTSAISGSNDDDDSNVSRGPASIGNLPQNTSGSKSGAGTAGVGSGSSSSSRRVSVGGSSDDVAREEAKLVNMRSGSTEGSIIISAVNNSAGNTANALSVPLSDDQYRALQANPQSFNMSQIEKSIPQDQIAQLEKKGEIVILLRNGSNPPYEVKVQKVNNKLVFVKDASGKEQKPVARTFTLKALQNETRIK